VMVLVMLLVLRTIIVAVQRSMGKSLYVFSLIDLAFGMYVGCGMSCVSELEAFTWAVAMLWRIGVSIVSVRLAKYF